MKNYKRNIMKMKYNFLKNVTKLLLPIRDFAVIYIDDILIFSENEQKHEQHLEQFIELIEEKGLNISPQKAELRKIE